MSEMRFYDLKQASGLAHSLGAQMARELGRRIVASNYEPGQLIEDEATLAQRYQVSRSVVRDAVKILVGKGLLEVRRGIGTRVRDRMEWGLLDDDVLAWHQSAPPQAQFLRQLTELRMMIEPKAARWAAERGTDEELASIASAQKRMESENGSIDDFVSADAHYHRAILRAAHNEFLGMFEGVIYCALLESIRHTNSDPRDNKNSLPYHASVTQAILQRSAGSAEKAMDLLLEETRHRLAARFPED